MSILERERNAEFGFSEVAISEVFMSTVTLGGKIEMLPLYRQQEISDYVDFLLSSANIAKTKDDPVVRKYPYAGCMCGTFGKKSDDFNEPLDDFKDYM